MRKMFLYHALVLFLPISALAKCPKNKKEWQAKGPKIFLEKATQHVIADVDMNDLSSKIGKKIKGSAVAFKEGKQDFVLIQVEDKDTATFLSGVMSCDPQTKIPALLSLTWVKGDKSGLVKLVRH